MALDNPEGSNVPRSMGQKRRWLVFGSNVVVALVLATALLVAVVWLSDALLQGKARSDWTAGGRFHLSDRTRALLAEIPEGDTIRITNLYPHTPQVPESEEQYRRVQDLLTEYEAVSRRITVEAINPGVDTEAAEALLDRLKKRYAGENEKSKATLETFRQLHTDVDAALATEADRIDAALRAWKDAPPEFANNLAAVSQSWRQLLSTGSYVATVVDSYANQPLPAYAVAISQASELLRPIAKNFGTVPQLYAQLLDEARTSNLALPSDVKAVLESAAASYGPLRKRIEAFLLEGDAVQEQKLEALSYQIGRSQSILIEAPSDVRVVSFDEVWAPNPNRPERLFNGESAVSTALWGLLHRVKPAVLFVTYGTPATRWGGPFAKLADRLRQSNFIVEDWDLLRSPEMPKIQEWDQLTAADLAKEKEQVLLVLTPPAPPDPRQPMPPATPEAYQAVRDAIRDGAPAVILADATAEPEFLPYRDLFALFGLAPRLNVAAIQKNVDARGNQQTIPWTSPITHYPSHSITNALRGLPTALVLATPLMPMEKPPAGVTIAPILLLPADADHWIETTLSEIQSGAAAYHKETDLAATADHPVPLAVAVTRKVGDVTQHVVVFGNSLFARDVVWQSPQDPLPGNAEIFANSLLWASGKEQLVTVSPEVLRARRLGDLGPWGTPIRVLLVAGVPAGTALVGLIVFLIRRR